MLLFQLDISPYFHCHSLMSCVDVGEEALKRVCDIHNPLTWSKSVCASTFSSKAPFLAQTQA